MQSIINMKIAFLTPLHCAQRPNYSRRRHIKSEIEIVLTPSSLLVWNGYIL